MNQPNISRLIKNLESEFGLTLFSRTSSGMVATRDGELFLMQAEKLVNNTDTFEHSFKHNEESTTSFRIALPRGSYLTKAFARTLNAVAEDHPVQVTFNETNNEEVIQCVSAQGYDVGIIRLPIEFESNYKKLLAEKQLKFQEIMVFRFVVVMHKDHPLANREYVHFSDLVNSSPSPMRRLINYTAPTCIRIPSLFLSEAVSLTSSETSLALSCSSPPCPRSCSMPTT